MMKTLLPNHTIARYFGAWSLTAHFLLGAATSWGATTSGTLTNSEAWNGTVNLTGDVTVPAGMTLTIQPGTTVQCLALTDDRAGGVDAGRIELILAGGVLTAIGAANNPIHFTTAGRSGTNRPGDWYGIRVTQNTGTSSVLENVELAYAQVGIRAENQNPNFVVRSSDLHDNASHGIWIRAYSGVYTGAAIEVKGSRIRNNGGNGVYLDAFTSGCDGATAYAAIRGNEIGGNGGAGVMLKADCSPTSYCSPRRRATAQAEVSGNRIHDNGSGISAEAWRSSSVVNYVSVAGSFFNNQILSNRAEGIVIIGGVEADAMVAIPNNTIFGNAGAGIRHFQVPSTSYPIVNNVVTGNAVGIQAVASLTPGSAAVANNDVTGNTNGNWMNYPAGYGTLTTTNGNGTSADFQMNLSTAPQFLGADDFHLQIHSPCINAGTAAAAPTTDLDGRQRIKAPDLGCYEVQPLRLMGDLDNDTWPTVLDMTLLVGYLRDTNSLLPQVAAFADVNRDGVVDSNDIPALADAILGRTILPLALDSDEDGIPDVLERVMGLDPAKKDSLGDGIADGDRDYDMDGLSNYYELQVGTDPMRLDSDGDGWSDDAELAVGSDPLDPMSRPFVMAVSTRPVSVVLPANEGPAGLTNNTVVANPPVALLLPANAGSSGLAWNTTVAQPPVAVLLPADQGAAGLTNNTFIGLPPVRLQIQGQ